MSQKLLLLGLLTIALVASPGVAAGDGGGESSGEEKEEISDPDGLGHFIVSKIRSIEGVIDTKTLGVP